MVVSEEFCHGLSRFWRPRGDYSGGLSVASDTSGPEKWFIRQMRASNAETVKVRSVYEALLQSVWVRFYQDQAVRGRFSLDFRISPGLETCHDF